MTKRQRATARAASVGVMFILWLTTFALTVSPEFHHLLHHDAQAPSHHCLITQMQQNSFLAGASDIMFPASPTALDGSVGQGAVYFPDSCEYRLTPSRAPPAVPAASVAG